MESLKRKKVKNKKCSIIFLGVFLMILGITVLICNYYNNKNKDKMNDKQIENFFQIEEQEESLSTTNEVDEDKSVAQEVVNYIAILEIPKINLKRGLFEKTSPQNNVNKNIYILKETTLPDEQVNSHIILAAHSGNSHVSFFKNVKKLDMKDKIYFYYKNIKYIYEVSNKYEIRKTGTANIKLTNTSDITLITCISGTNKQVVYVATLIEKIDY